MAVPWTALLMFGFTNASEVIGDGWTVKLVLIARDKPVTHLTDK